MLTVLIRPNFSRGLLSLLHSVFIKLGLELWPQGMAPSTFLWVIPEGEERVEGEEQKEEEGGGGETGGGKSRVSLLLLQAKGLCWAATGSENRAPLFQGLWQREPSWNSAKSDLTHTHTREKCQNTAQSLSCQDGGEVLCGKFRTLGGNVVSLPKGRKKSLVKHP